MTSFLFTRFSYLDHQNNPNPPKYQGKLPLLGMLKISDYILKERRRKCEREGGSRG
jgi:hypothetical protein